jgi:hypothetical protein
MSDAETVRFRRTVGSVLDLGLVAALLTELDVAVEGRFGRLTDPPRYRRDKLRFAFSGGGKVGEVSEPSLSYN